MKIFEVEQGSLEWLKLRLGVITGTRGKKVCSSTNLDLVDELIAEIETQEVEQVYQNDAMKWGTEYEPHARLNYIKYSGNEIKEIGFCLSDWSDMIGISTDGYTTDFKGGVEIKCPNTKTHVKYIRMGQLPSEHKHQVFHNFIVNEKLEWLDFISFDPRFKACQMFIKRVNRKEIEIELAEYKAELEKFLSKFDKYQKAVLS